MEQIVRKLVQAGYRTPQCVAVHGIFAADAYARIRQAGAAGITTCNTVPHPTNGIDVTPPIVAAVRSMLDRSAEGWKESAI
jgi:ribose-phosphate pyrophosphokinase